MKRALLAILHAVESVVMTVLGFGCIFAVLLAIALVVVWLVMR